ncbi:MAG: hypothetical protein ACRD22_20770, partial [Terriglobia bacterium]
MIPGFGGIRSVTDCLTARAASGYHRGLALASHREPRVYKGGVLFQAYVLFLVVCSLVAFRRRHRGFL